MRAFLMKKYEWVKAKAANLYRKSVNAVQEAGKSLVTAAGAGVTMISSTAHAAYTAQDYSGILAGIQAEITSAMPNVLTIAATLIGIGVGIRLLRKAGRI